MNPLPHTPLIILGAGFSGISTAIQTERLLSLPNYEIYDKSPSLGGTWALNTYPGCGVDIPSHFYSWSWSLNPNWSRQFVSQQEILECNNHCPFLNMKGEAKRWGIDERIRFNVECTGAEWSDLTELWTVKFLNLITGEGFERKCRVLISCIGIFREGKPFAVPGIEDFEGDVWHSSQWNHAISLKDKKVVVVGNGCSATQFVPEILKESKSVTQIIRSQHYVHERPNPPFPEWFKWIMRNVPGMMRLYRWILAMYIDTLFTAFKTQRGARERTRIERATKKYMKRTSPQKYHSILLPTYPLGSKRRVFDTNYLSCLHLENMFLTNDTIVRVKANGVVTQFGKEYDADIIVLANGFETQKFIQPIRIVNSSRGVSLDDTPETGIWKDGPEAYLGCCYSGFPNFFTILGPNTVTGHHSTVYTAECSINYSLRIARVVLSGHASSVEVTSRAMGEYNKWIQKELENLIWTKENGGWYVSKETGRNLLIYPGYMTGYWMQTLKGSLVPRYTDFRVRGGNRWIEFYLGLLSGKIRRNRWALALVVAMVGLAMGQVRLGVSMSLQMILLRCREWLMGFWNKVKAV